MLKNVLTIHPQYVWWGKSHLKLASTFVSHHLPTMLALHGNAISFLAKIWVAHLVNLRYEVRYESGNISGKVCRKLLAFQQVLWMDRPTRHVGGWECPGRWWEGKPVAAQWHLCQLSALLKADQCVSGWGKSNNRRLVTSQPASQRGSWVQPVALLIDARQLMPTGAQHNPTWIPCLTVDIALECGHQVGYFGWWARTAGRIVKMLKSTFTLQSHLTS